MLNLAMPLSVVARVNSERAECKLPNADEFTHVTHDRNLDPATPAGGVESEEFGGKMMRRLRAFALFGAVLLTFSASATGIEAAIRGVVGATDPENNTYSVVYDAWGRAKVFVNPDQTESSVVFGPGSLVLEVINEANNVWSFSYDDVGRLVSVVNPLEEETTFTYNAVGWVTAVTNGRNYTRTYTYTDRGEVSSLTLPDNSVEQWTYNANAGCAPGARDEIEK